MKDKKISIRFYNDREVRAIWVEDRAQWQFSVLDVIGAINEQDDYAKTRNYWKYLKTKLRKENNELVSATNQLKMLAPDGKNRLTDTLDAEGIAALAKVMPNQKATAFLDWLTYSDNTIDGQSKRKAYSLYESNMMENFREGTIQALQQIHAYIFGGLYDFAGQIRTKTISKGGFTFCLAQYLPQQLEQIERMSETTLDEVFDKYVEMNVAHPFMEGNGRSTRIWLDLMLKARHHCCIDWSKIGKRDYLEAMTQSVADASRIKQLLHNAITHDTDSREIFMKGIDYSYYYEQEDEV
ncbi:MAG: protein adenylyltransferase Fic [Candidatus Limimorpha sp.]